MKSPLANWLERRQRRRDNLAAAAEIRLWTDGPQASKQRIARLAAALDAAPQIHQDQRAAHAAQTAANRRTEAP